MSYDIDFWHFCERFLNFDAKNARKQNGGAHDGKMAHVQQWKWWIRMHLAEALKITLYVYLNIS